MSKQWSTWCTALVTLTLMVGCNQSTPSKRNGYIINLSGSDQIGDRSLETMTADVTVSTRVYEQGKTLNEEENVINVKVTAESEVLDVVNGKTTWMRYTVKSASVTINGRSSAAPAAGTTVECHRVTGFEEPTGLPANLDPLAITVLNSLLSAERPDTPNDEEVFGTKEPMRVGDKWEIDLEQFRSHWQVDNFPLARATLSGHSELVGVTQVEGVEYLQVFSRVHAENIQPELPSGAQLEQATLDSTNSILISSDGVHVKEEHFTVDANLAASAPGGRRLVQYLNMAMSVDYDDL